MIERVMIDMRWIELHEMLFDWHSFFFWNSVVALTPSIASCFASV